MTPAQLEARNLSHDEVIGLLSRMVEKEYPHILQPAMMRELIYRLTTAERIADLLENAIFYARMYRDTSEDGRARREDMIDDAVSLISIFRNGGIYP